MATRRWATGSARSRVSPGRCSRAGRRIRVAVLTAAVALGIVPAATAAAQPSMTVSASPRNVASGRSATLSGTVTGLPAGAVVRLYVSPFPYPVAKLLRTTTTTADGSYSFTVHPDRNTRYRVLVPGTPANALGHVGVTGLAIVKVHAVALGRALVTIVVFHPRDLLHWDGSTVRWLFASDRPGALRSAGATQARRLSPSVVILRTTVALPAGPFRLPGVLHAAGRRRARGLAHARHVPSASAIAAPDRLPAGFPGPAAIARAAAYLSGRDRAQGVRGRRHRRPPLGRQRPLDVPDRERRQGDAARRIPAPPRRPRPTLDRLRSATRSCIR